MTRDPWQLGIPVLLVAALCAGCGRNRLLQSREPLLQGGQTAPTVDVVVPEVDIPDITSAAPPRASTAPAAPVTPTVDASQFAAIQRKADDLERNNQSLHADLASEKQKIQTLQDQVNLLQDKLGETVTQLRDTQVARDEADRRAQAILASTKKQGASFTANNSVRQSLEVVNLPGLDVRQDGDVIRIAIPADRLFQLGSVEWVAGASTLLDQVAATISRSYPRQQIAIEGHTDSSIIGLPGGSQQLAASQSLAVFQHLTSRNQLPAKQLVTMAYGPNYPRFTNGTDEGRKQNRRIELVIYPEQIK